jgi:cell division septum initiation protein DivIVA
MTKEKEIAILTKAASDLGTASYCGTWLASIIWELERDLRSDFLPVLTLAEARKRADDLLVEAQAKAEQIRQTAQRQADKLQQEAITEAQRIRAGVRHDLQKALNSIL